MFTCEFEKGFEVRPIDRLHTSTLGSKTHNRVRFRPPSRKNPSSRVGPLSERISVMDLSSQLLLREGLTRQRSCKRGKNLKWRCDPSTN